MWFGNRSKLREQLDDMSIHKQMVTEQLGVEKIMGPRGYDQQDANVLVVP